MPDPKPALEYAAPKKRQSLIWRIVKISLIVIFAVTVVGLMALEAVLPFP